MHRPTTRILLASFCILLCSGRLPALQGSKADYERAAGLGRLHAGKMLRADVRPTWLDATRLWYQVRTGPVTSEFVLVDLAAPKDERRQVLATDAELAQILGVGRDQGRVARLAVDAEGSLQLLLWGEAGAFAWNRATGTAAPLDPAEVGAFQLESRARIRPSRQRGRPTGILFVNTTEGPAQLFWLDTGGERRDYGEIAAGGRKWQGTTDGHAFFAEAPDGTVLGRFVAETEPGVAVLSWQAATREPAQPREGSQPREGRDGPRRTPENDEAAFEPFVRDHDLWLRDRQSGTEQRLTTDGSEGNAYGGPFLWSPDGGRLACLQTEPAQEHTVHFVESAPRDQLQPKLHSFDYLKPGDVVAHQRVRMFAVGSGGAARALPVGDELAPEPYNLSRFAWDPDGSHFTYLYNQRGHQIQRWIAVDAESGASTVRIEERSETFVDYAQKTWAYRLEATDELIWASERSGWNHLYLLDAGTGAVKRALTSGEFVVRGIEQVDEARRRALIRISGYHSDQDPYHVHWALVGLDDAAMTVLTQGDGTHEVAWAPDGEHYVDTWSRVDQPPVTELRRAADGGLVAELERADDSLLRATGSEPPQRFVAKGRDGTTDIWGV
ncbi:MAG TPA: DPP IV N-terminal domain-containing protein, partial [Planctomycetota bacterium]